MTPEIIVGIIFGVLNLLFFYQQNKLIKQGNNIMREQLKHDQGDVSRIDPITEPSFKRYWPMLAMAILTVLAWAAVVTWITERHSVAAYNPAEKKEMVESRTYSNESVELDGKAFENCTFTNVTFIFRGKSPYTIANSTIIGKVNLRFVIGPQLGSAQTVALLINELCRTENIGCVNGAVQIGGIE